MTLLELDNDHVVAICRVLTEHGVSYVVIGGIAARLHETGHATVDMEFALHARRTTSLVLRLRFERLAREFVSMETPRVLRSSRTPTFWPT